MQKRAFTLIELAIVLTIIGLLIGGSFKVMKMMREKAKTAEAKELVLGAKNAVFGYAAKEYFLPLNSEFDANLSTSKDPNHKILYIADTNLQYDDICAFSTTDLNVSNRGSMVGNVAFVIAHEGANYNMQTALNTAVTPNVVTIHGADAQVDDNTTPVNILESYDDIVEWATLKQLQDDVGCVDKQFRFVTDKLPNAKVLIPYPNISGTAKLEVENALPGKTVSMDCAPRPQFGIDFNTTAEGFNFYGTPTEANTITFECNATVTNSSQFAQKKFVITIDPNYDREKSQNCTLNTECSGGYCAGGVCTTGGFGEICDNQNTPNIFDLENSDCKSAICYDADGNGTGICSGDIGNICSDENQCLGGFCAGGVCTTGVVGANCDNSANDCQSGFCAGGVCTTGAFDIACDDAADCKSGICQGGLCSGYLGDVCSANSQCLSGYCDANSTCASIPYDTNSTGGGSGGGGGGVVGGVPSCSLASSPSIINTSQTTTLTHSITNGPASGSFSPSSGDCSSFTNSTGGSCTTATLSRNTLFMLSISNAYGNGSCNTSVCVATKTGYRIYNNTGTRRDFKIDGSCRRVNNNSEITTSSLRLNSGESVISYSSSNRSCSGEVASITFNQAVCADNDADGLVNFSGADR